MKLLFASDLHGDVGAVKELLTVFEKEKADRLVLLGDLLYHGPRNDLPSAYDPKGVIAALNAIKGQILAVRGNCDTEVDQMVLEFPMMADYALLEVDGIQIYATHGHLWNEQCQPPMTEGTVLLNGHTHIPACNVHGRFIYMNPGSVSIPKGGSCHSYMTLEKGLFRWKDLSGDVYREHQI
jgi:putative phosphoesterase